MGKIRRLSKEAKEEMVRLYQQNVKQIDIARRYNANRNVVSYVMKIFEARGTVKNAPKSGQPNVKETDAALAQRLQNQPLLTVKEIKGKLELQDVSSRTVSRRLIDVGLIYLMFLRKNR